MNNRRISEVENGGDYAEEYYIKEIKNVCFLLKTVNDWHQRD